MCGGSGLGESNYWYVDQNHNLFFFLFFHLNNKQLITSIDKTSEMVSAWTQFFFFSTRWHTFDPIFENGFSTRSMRHKERTLTFWFLSHQLDFQLSEIYTNSVAIQVFFSFSYFSLINFYFWSHRFLLLLLKCFAFFFHSQMREFDFVNFFFLWKSISRK